MSKFTTQLRWVVEQEQKYIPFSQTLRYTPDTYKKIGLDSYPIFDEDYRSTLNDKIIDHFFFREIGFETVAQFAWYMRRTMNEIMPYYNEMYLTQEMIDDPLTDHALKWNESWDSDVKDTGTINDDRTKQEQLGGSDRTINHTEVDADGTTYNRNVFQDTPMSLLDNSSAPTVEGLDYATTVTYDDGTTHDESVTDGTSTTNYGRTTDTTDNNERTLDTNKNDKGWRVHDEKGRKHSQMYLMKEYRDLFVNIDLEIISDLEDLFMGLW